MQRKTIFSLSVAFIVASACSTVREVPTPDLEADGQAKKLETDDYLAYTVMTDIDADIQKVWSELTTAERWRAWNTELISLDGEIKKDETVALVVKLDPERTFNLNVSTFDAPSADGAKMVWEDGNGMFKGVRTYTLKKVGEQTRFQMTEVLSGAMLGMIKPELPNFAPSFTAFARDLKGASEGE